VERFTRTIDIAVKGLSGKEIPSLDDDINHGTSQQVSDIVQAVQLLPQSARLVFDSVTDF